MLFETVAHSTHAWPLLALMIALGGAALITGAVAVMGWRSEEKEDLPAVFLFTGMLTLIIAGTFVSVASSGPSPFPHRAPPAFVVTVTQTVGPQTYSTVYEGGDYEEVMGKKIADTYGLTVVDWVDSSHPVVRGFENLEACVIVDSDGEPTAEGYTRRLLCGGEEPERIVTL